MCDKIQMSKVVIESIGVLTPIGFLTKFSEQLFEANTAFSEFQAASEQTYPVARAAPEVEEMVKRLRDERAAYRSLDRSALFSIGAARECLGNRRLEDVGVNIGTSRGTTSSFEDTHTQFLRSGKVPAFTSPVTTLGNLSSWVLHDQGMSGAPLVHAATCTGGLAAVANGMAWLRSGMCKHFLAGASEAPLTPYTLAQMEAIGICGSIQLDYPCQPLASKRHPESGLVVGEGAGMLLLRSLSPEEEPPHGSVEIVEAALASEEPRSRTGVDPSGAGLIRSMGAALRETTPREVDAVITHAPGTKAGEEAELAALRTVFSKSLPPLLSPKWKFGHLFGASALLSIAAAFTFFRKQRLLETPYDTLYQESSPERLERILVNAAGFGGVTGSVLLRYH